MTIYMSMLVLHAINSSCHPILLTQTSTLQGQKNIISDYCQHSNLLKSQQISHMLLLDMFFS